ncbi:S41 family peptidase [Granulicella arctica]|uniref:S41 family peptidase n=1 Tax=Granulicella arctica TaxID=940613 RepID=UPI0021E02DA7|nr:S41 family peptidase [Granulicella arctica]
MMELTRTQRAALLTKIEAAVVEKYFEPDFDEARWKGIVNRHRSTILDAQSTVDFETATSEMLTELSPKTLGLLSERTPINPRNAINASFSVQSISDQLRWVFQDVLPGGVAAKAGVRAGDVLVEVAGKPMVPKSEASTEPPFEMQESIAVKIARGKPATELSLSLNTGTPKYKDNPYSQLTPVTTGSQPNGTAYLKVSLFQGKVGIDFANELDRLFAGQFSSSQRLIIDLRGNPGGGIGGLTLMSYLTPDRLPIGYSRNRKMAQERKDPASLPIFDRVPRSKLAIPGLALKFMGKTSVFLYTEAQGKRSFHGRVLILVNEHTTGAAEMVAQFAQENKLAIIAGAKTPGRLVSRSATKLGSGYRLIVPVAAYISAKGTQIEGKGITPDIEIPWSYTDAAAGRDNQLETAVEALRTAI